MTDAEATELLNELLGLEGERECVEWKLNNTYPDAVGEYISALANSACLLGEPRAYLIWGINDTTREIVGTNLTPRTVKIGNEELESWLSHHLAPRPDFRIHQNVVNGKPVAFLEIPAASHTPVRFKDFEYIRVGSYKKKLRDFQEKERALWAKLAAASFETGIAANSLTVPDALRLLAIRPFFRLLGEAVPATEAEVVERLVLERVLVRSADALVDVTNLGAILLAVDLARFGLSRKGVRVIEYRGVRRTDGTREASGRMGYGVGFEALIHNINARLPPNQVIGEALRVDVPLYPSIAIRELVANALIHQDFSIGGSGPMVEIFSDRIEITNPGAPLIDIERLLDAPPQSRNDSFALMMRRLGICEERGSGIDKVVEAVEVFQLPAPDFVVNSNHTKTTLFAHRPLTKMSRNDRTRACYQHACLQYVSGDELTNKSLRTRFAISARDYSVCSRIIADTLNLNLIKPADPESNSKKHAKYVPFWA